MIHARPTTTNGEARKAAAHSLLEARRAHYLGLARRFFVGRLVEHGTATVDDVRALVELPDGINPTLFGALPTPLARAGIIRQEGFARTTRAVAHARPVAVWALADEAKARAWLDAHPAPPTVVPGEQRLLPIVAEQQAAATASFWRAEP
jgi:hypothetical protein